MNFLYIFFRRYLQKKISKFWRNYFGKIFKIQVWVSRGTIFRNIIFEKEYFFFVISYFEQKPFGLMAKKTLAVLLKLHPTCPEEQLWKFFWKRYTSFHHFPILSQKLSTFWQKVFGRLVKMQSECPGDQIEETTFLIRIYVVFDRFSTSRPFFRTLREYFSTVVQIAF